MSTPTDRGYVLITLANDGAKIVAVGNRQDVPGQISEIFAMHSNATRIIVGSEVALQAAGDTQWSQDIVEVVSEGGGVVHIDGPWAHTRPVEELLAARRRS